MKTVGLVGGTGWISSAEYYRIINEETNKRSGGLTFSRCILYSVNYGEIDAFNKQGNKEGVYSLILDATSKLAGAGADCIVLCANTLHQFIERLEQETDLPFIHIADTVAREIGNKKMSRVGLLGTKQTMEMDFYKSRLNEREIEVLIPGLSDRDFIQKTISDELLKGVFSDVSRYRFVEICKELHGRGAEGIVLGCTEIPLLLKQEDINIPVINTLTVHAMAAVDYALND
ncbi:MAG: amino acid racemase [Bacteroidales bacterium]|jgi:aspartate racemase|nr:amino acid racemase [Bacteroidales bacterium]